jgi:WD40 repeat protein
VWRVIFSPKSSTQAEEILTSGADGTSRLWTRSGHPVAVIASHPLGTYDSVFSMDGNTILSGGLDGKLRMWTIAPLRELLTENCQQLQPYFNNPQIQTDASICKNAF